MGRGRDAIPAALAGGRVDFSAADDGGAPAAGHFHANRAASTRLVSRGQNVVVRCKGAGAARQGCDGRAWRGGRASRCSSGEPVIRPAAGQMTMLRVRHGPPLPEPRHGRLEPTCGPLHADKGRISIRLAIASMLSRRPLPSPCRVTFSVPAAAASRSTASSASSRAQPTA